MADETLRTVSLRRVEGGRFEITNVRGGTMTIGSGEDGEFTPVELLLAAIGGCSAIDVDILTSRRAEPVEFAAEVSGDKIRDSSGNHLTNLTLTFTVTFPDGEGGDAARKLLPEAAKISHDRLCTVSRTVELGEQVTVRTE